jgi:hypothetical protein
MSRKYTLIVVLGQHLYPRIIILVEIFDIFRFHTFRRSRIENMNDRGNSLANLILSVMFGG